MYMKKNWILPLLLFLLLTSCDSKQKEDPLFPANIIRQAEQDLKEKSNYLTNGSTLWDITRIDSLSKNEQAALTWIYAYSWTPDVIDIPVEFHLKNIQKALLAREELPWGKSVPADQWRHFVLPLRINNEILDDFRTIYYEELRDLVKGMTMEEAVLEINHWAHQHITYEPSDGRTSSPLATLRNALGRCGEQSTFMTTALRTVGIPARQVYTPRWAHTDDNHAWVEAWVDGEWRYLGASEPAPVLDNAWFDAPVLRAMLLHTKAFGHYSGTEEWLGQNYVNTELNVSDNYIPTAPAKVIVKDNDGNPVEGAKVTFRLYNYAELYPLVTRETNKLGEASVKVGLGDLIVVASKSDEEMAIGQISVKEGGTSIELTLKPYSEWPDELHFRLTPPIAKAPVLDISEEKASECNKRMAENNRIRKAYTDTFPSEEDAQVLANELGLKGKIKDDFIKLFPLSRGYHKEIKSFLVGAKSNNKENEAVLLLSSLAEKDLHDINIKALQEILARDLTPEEWQNPRIISPRVMLEHIYPGEPELKAIADQILSEVDEGASRLSMATKIAEAVTFKMDKRYNPSQLSMNPLNVYKNKIGDTRNQIILLVRLLRSARIPAEFDMANSVVRIWDEKNQPQIVPFLDTKKEENDEEKKLSAECELMLNYQANGFLKHPKYYSNFTVGYINEGQLVTYDFDYDQSYQKISGEKLVYPNNFISTGVRLANGTVLLNMQKIKCGSPSPLLFDRDDNSVSVIGNFDAESLYFDQKLGENKSIISTTGRGYYILIIGKQHHEPTDHILRDMQKLKDEKNQLPLPVIVLTSDKASQDLQSLLPEAVWGEDSDGIEEKVIAGCELPSRIDKPLVIIADTFNRVVYFSQGYTIGIGDRLTQVIDQLEE